MILKQKQYLNRPQMTIEFRDPFYLTVESGHKWKPRRDFIQQSLFTSICNKSFVLNAIEHCFDKELCPKLDKIIETQQFWNAKQDMSYCVLFGLMSAMFGVNLKRNDPFIQQWMDNSERIFDGVKLIIMLTIFNIHIPSSIMWKLSDYNLREAAQDNLLRNWMQNTAKFKIDFQRNIIQRTQFESEKKSEMMSQQKCFIDLVIDGLENKEIDFELPVILTDIMAMMTAGLDPTSNTAQFAILWLAKYPKQQSKIYEELKYVCDHKFTFEKLNELHLFRAFIYEMIRLFSAVPTALPHIGDQDFNVKLNGKDYVIPANAVININVLGIENNQSNMLKNGEYDLSIWLDENGKFKMFDGFITFGYAKRNCVGKEYAIKVLIALFATIIMKYRIIAKDNDTSFEIKRMPLLTMRCEEMPIQLQKR